MTVIVKTPPARKATTRLLWLDLTRKCQLACGHCYNSSGPSGSHGTMTREDWVGVLDQAAACGVRGVQFIGGEPTMHPDFTALVDHALNAGLEVEVYSNLVHVSQECWEIFRRKGLALATSYYSGRAETHNAMTGRRSHGRTRENIARAVRLGIPLRVGVVTGDEEQAAGARRDLEALGVERIGIDHVRPFGRGGQGRVPDTAKLCGRCGSGVAAIGPTGEVSPCVFSGWMGVGNVRHTPLAAILGGEAMTRATTAIQGAAGRNDPCGPDDEECTPGFPGSSCSPRN
ncbi:radical SAM/SPASM domain-containing protein [Streptomyces barkulensis]|uniref:radical SAM/SPASM domain-containing protein n=1 Tax=Streptomyces barkulensis TaxID=1257026 RepID=UPI000C6E316E|nr:radical SAM/SPASM domain-containing protein [Streptomyces barkulensis]